MSYMNNNTVLYTCYIVDYIVYYIVQRLLYCVIYSTLYSALLRGRPPAALAPSQADSLAQACFASLACNTGTSPPLPRAARAAVRAAVRVQ